MTLCDVVVELDGSHKFVDRAERLSQHLLLGSLRSLQGTHLQDLLHEDMDRALLTNSLTSPSLSVGVIPAPLHVRIRDSIGNILMVELFRVPFEHISGYIHHLVGVRDFPDPTPIAPPRELHLNSGSSE